MGMTKKITALRLWMKEDKIDAFLVPRADMFQGENVAPCDERLEWLTGFDGSAGLAIVGEKKAGLFVDGRYTIQAPTQVDTEIFDICQVPQTKPVSWIKETLFAGGIVGFDPWLHPLAQIRAYKKAFDLSGIVMKMLKVNPIDMVWDNQPEKKHNSIWLHDLKFSGQSSQDKRNSFKQKILDADIDAVLLTDPESISWLFNIRGSDIPNTPTVHSFAWITSHGEDVLFIDQNKISTDMKSNFDSDVSLVDISDIEEKIKQISEVGTTVQLDSKNCPYALYNILVGCAVSLKEGDDPCLVPKACKNKTEIDGARQAHVIDGVAVVKFLHWFDEQSPKGDLDELAVVDKLHSLRSENNDFVEDSFDTISGFESNGAIVHYRATDKTNKPIKGDSILLLDSGGQYFYGTTDITRTVAVGNQTAEMKDRFTRVLKGMIALSMARFPVNTFGAALDTLARQPLWDIGLDYAHGTGHGVGSFLSVHEGPQGISSRSMAPLKPGMIISNEPGYYKAGEYGIRIENLILAVDDTKASDEQPMLKFETLTLAPIDNRLIDETLLSDAEKAWFKNYHARVYDELSDYLSNDEKAWLKKVIA